MEKSFRLQNTNETKALFGRHDENIRIIENRFGVKSVLRGEEFVISGKSKDAEKAAHVVNELLLTIRNGGYVKKHEVQYAIEAISGDETMPLHDIYLNKIEISSKRLYITPKSRMQKSYIDAIKNYDVVFGIGPAGTGKTYLAMAMAVNALKKQIVSRIILTRPAVEAGESLGYLPGDMHDKVSPYLRPLYDALYDMMEGDKIQNYVERGIIEVAPLAYMRGRTLNDSFIVLDEAQNSTREQMKMFLTRLGFDSKVVVTGDVTQSDLPKGKVSGLSQVTSLLKHIEGLKFIYFSDEDIVRHELVQQIIKAYQEEEAGRSETVQK